MVHHKLRLACRIPRARGPLLPALVLCFLLAAGPVGSAAGTPDRVLHVPADYPTIAAALAVAGSGDRVEVAAGTYYERGLNVPEDVTLAGAGWAATTIDSGGSGTVVYAAAGATVTGLTLRGSGAGYFDSGIWVSNGTVALRENRLTGNSAGVWGWCFDAATCHIRVTLEGNLIDGNASNGVNSNAPAVFLLRHNTIAANRGSGVILNDPGSLAENNIIASNTGDGLVNNADAQVSHNDAWGNGRDYVGGGAGPGGLSVDPLFRDAGRGDYRLYAGSPVRGTGTPPGSTPGALPFAPAGAPPASVTLSAAGSGAWNVRWTPSGAAGYYVYYGSCTRQATAIVDAGPVTSYQIRTDDAAAVGYVAVSGYDAGGGESDVRVAEGIRASCPAAPRDLEAGAFPGGQIRLQWLDAAANEDGYRVERSSGAVEPATYTQIADLPPGAQVYTDTPPLLEETYWYRVAAYNANGPSPYSNRTYNATFGAVPNLDERYLLVLINEARADPAAFGFPGIAPVPPLAYNPLLNYAAHSHSQAILNSDFRIGHCDLIGRCPSERAHAVGYHGGVAENLIQGMTGPAWVESSNRAFLDSAGHRDNMLCACFNEAGLGHTYDPAKAPASHWKGQYTETFSGREGVVLPHLPAGVVVPYWGPSATRFTFLVNYYDAAGQAPLQAQVVIDGAAHAMTLAVGAAANGTYRYAGTLPAGEHAYHFRFTFPGGTETLPATGSYAVTVGRSLYLPVVQGGW